MLFVQLDTNWPDNPKLIRAGLAGAGLHATCMCVAKRLETDGWIDRIVLIERYKAPEELIDQLVTLGLLEAEGDVVRPWDWHDRNPSQAAIDAKRAMKAEAGRKGNHAKWDHPGPFESCPKCQPDSLVVAGCDPIGSQEDRTTDPTRSPESESEAAASDATGPVEPPDLDRLLEAAAAVIGARAAGRPSTIDPVAVAISVAGRTIANRRGDASRIIQEHGGITPERLAELLEPKPSQVSIAPNSTRVVTPPPVEEVLADQPPEDWATGLDAIRELIRSQNEPLVAPEVIVDNVNPSSSTLNPLG